MKLKHLLIILLVFVCMAISHAQYNKRRGRMYAYPEISNLNTEIDHIYQRLNKTVSQTYKEDVYIISPSDFIAADSDFQSSDLRNTGNILYCNSIPDFDVTATAALHLPDGAIMTDVAYHIYRDDTSSGIEARIYKVAFGSESASVVANTYVISISTGTWETLEKTTLGDDGNGEVIDNRNYQYYMHVLIQTNDAVLDAKFSCAVIKFKIDQTKFYIY